MLANFPSPVLAVATDVLRDLEGADALYGLWTLFTKCKGSLKDGQRLENLSWRLWYREMVESQSDRYRRVKTERIQAKSDSVNSKTSVPLAAEGRGSIHELPSLFSAAAPSLSQSSTTLTTSCPPLSTSSSLFPPSSTSNTVGDISSNSTSTVKGAPNSHDNAVSGASAYRSPAPSLSSFCSPSTSTISLSDSANSNYNESDQGAKSSDVQPGRFMSGSTSNALSYPTASKSSPVQKCLQCNHYHDDYLPQRLPAQSTTLSSNSKLIKSHIPSPITSPSPSPCPSSPAPSQAPSSNSSIDDRDSCSVSNASPSTGNIPLNSTGANEINGDFRPPDVNDLIKNIDISGRHGGAGKRSSREGGEARDQIRLNGEGGDNALSSGELACGNPGMSEVVAKLELQAPGASTSILIPTKNVRPTALARRRPSAVGRIICQIIPRSVVFPFSVPNSQDARTLPALFPSLARSVQSSMQIPGQVPSKMQSESQRKCPLPTPEHESNGMNLTVVTTSVQTNNVQALDTTTAQNSNSPIIAVTITPSPSPSPQYTPAPAYVTSHAHSTSNPTTLNRSPTHSIPGTPQRSPMSSHPQTPTTAHRSSPHTPTTTSNNASLTVHAGLAPLVVVVNPTPQPTPHPTPPATPTLVPATVPAFVTACGVGSGLMECNDIAKGSPAGLPVPTEVAPVPARHVPTATAGSIPGPPAVNSKASTETQEDIASDSGGAGSNSNVRGPLPVPDQRDVLPPGKPPSAALKKQPSKPDLSVMVDKDRTLKPSDRRFFLLQSPVEKSPDSATSRSASSMGLGGSATSGSVSPSRGRAPTVVEVDEDEEGCVARQVSHKKSESADAGAGGKGKERSLSRDARPLSRTKNRSAGMLAVGKRSTSTTALVATGGGRVRSKGLGLGGGLTMTKSKGAGLRVGLAGKAAGMRRTTSGGVVSTNAVTSVANISGPFEVADDKAKKSDGPPAGIPSTILPNAASKPQVPSPPPQLAAMDGAEVKHRASFNIGSGSSEGVETNGGGSSSRGGRSGSGSRGGSASPRKLSRPSAGITKLLGVTQPDVVNNVLRNTGGPGGAQATVNQLAQVRMQTTTHNVKAQKARSPSPPTMTRLPNPASLALNPEAANAAIQPSRKRVVLTNTSSEDYETDELDEDEDDDEDGSWASEELSEDEEVTLARGGQNGNAASNATKRSRNRGGSVGGRGKGASSSQSRGGGSTKGKGRSPAQNGVRAPAQAQRTKPEQPPQQQQQPPVPPPLNRRHTSHVLQGQRRVLSKEDEAALKLQAAAVEAQRQRELFIKVPVQPRGPGGMQRTRSGLLSQLMNPDPSIFPPNHPYRQSYSAVDLRRMANVPRVVSAGAGGFTVLNGANAIAPLPSIADIGSNHARHVSEQAPLPGPPKVGSLRISKGAAAVPLAAQVTVTQVPVVNGSGASGGYRPKGRPQGEELEDDTDTDDNPDNSIQVSKSYAQQKLAALAGRRTAPANGRQQQPPPQRPPLARALTTVEPAPPTPAPVTNPVPLLAHPYNLPPPPPPSTPRTTRRLMLQSEMSESLRRNLLWERQVSKTHLGPRRRSTGTGPNGVSGRPGHLTTTPSMVQLSAKAVNSSAKEAEEKERERRREAELMKERDERKQRALARTRSWADEYHYSGW